MTDVEKVSPGTETGTPDRLDRSVWLIAGVVVLGSIMSILDVTVVNIAMPTFQRQWHVAATSTAWTMTGYTLALATVIPITGWAADRFGTKRLYMTAMVLFVAGSVLCSTAGGIGELITYRVVQGLGGGMLMPLGMTMMTRAAGPSRVGQVMAVLGVPMLLGPICGPILGGWLIQIASWHWIFLINLPIGICGLVFAYLVLPKDQEHKSESFDFLGMVLLSPGLALFLYGVTSIPRAGTVLAKDVLIPAIIGLVLIAGFVFHALRAKNPLIDLGLFRNRNVMVAAITMVVFTMSFFGTNMLLPQYFQEIRGQGTLNTGLLLIPSGIGAMLTMPVGGRLVDKIGPGKVVLTGLTLILIGMSVFMTVDAHSHYWLLLGGLFVMGMGLGSTMMPTMTAALSTLTHQQVARGSTLMNILSQVGSSCGTAIIAVVLTNNLKHQQGAQEAIGAQLHALPPGVHLPQRLLETGLTNGGHGFGYTFIVSVALIACCLIPAAFLPRSKAAQAAAAGDLGQVDDAPALMH
jgi:EmrB/QacA subfamily drug resistance transporter